MKALIGAHEIIITGGISSDPNLFSQLARDYVYHNETSFR